jgi:ferredoxin
MIRVLEMRESIKILQQAFATLPAGPIMDPKAKLRGFRPKPGEAYGRIEGPKGRDRLLPRQRRQPQSLPLPRAPALVHQPHHPRGHVPRPTCRRRRDHPRQRRHRPRRGRSLTVHLLPLSFFNFNNRLTFSCSAPDYSKASRHREELRGSFHDPARLTTVEYPEQNEAPRGLSQFPVPRHRERHRPDGHAALRRLPDLRKRVPAPVHLHREIADKKPDATGKPKVFAIDTSVCMSCQICVEVCPFDAIKMDQHFEIATTDRFNRCSCSTASSSRSPNTYYHQIHPTEAAEVDARLARRTQSRRKKAAAAAAAKAAACRQTGRAETRRPRRRCGETRHSRPGPHGLPRRPATARRASAEAPKPPTDLMSPRSFNFPPSTSTGSGGARRRCLPRTPPARRPRSRHVLAARAPPLARQQPDRHRRHPRRFRPPLRLPHARRTQNPRPRPEPPGPQPHAYPAHQDPPLRSLAALRRRRQNALTKEDIVPRDADKILHFLAPVVLLAFSILTFAVIPFGRNLMPVELDAAVLYFFAAGAATELAVFMAGWASRNKYSLLAAMRALAQLISYELPLLLAWVPVVLVAGSLSTTASSPPRAVGPSTSSRTGTSSRRGASPASASS